MVRDGYLYGIALLAVALALHLLAGGWLWSIVPLLLAAFFLWFFRDPERPIPQGDGLVVSPADGKVTEVIRVTTPECESLRVSIFLSVFDVHVNRSPVGGLLSEVRYQKGEFLNALKPASAERNEQNLAVVDADEGYTVAFKQIAGLLARRIVFNPAPGTRLERGQRIGMIKFGSRVDVLLPGNAQLQVRRGDRVKGGSTILANIPSVEPSSVDDSFLAEMLV
ncbi:MAG: phosphatidylserine decarboxylase family protein [Silvibacterium sp.]|nr:phosphatidylserine decarboxylase family protein [Silvibacterium sp.]